MAWGLPGDGIYAARTVRAVDLDGIQLELGSCEAGYPLTQREVMKGYLEDKGRYGMGYPALVPNDVMVNGFVSGRDTEHGRIAYGQVAFGIETAKGMGTDRIMVPSFIENLAAYRHHVEHTRKALSYAYRLAAPEGVLTLTENALDWKEREELLRDIGADSLKIHFDTQSFKFNFGMGRCEQLEHLYPPMNSVLYTRDGEAGPNGRSLGRGSTDFEGRMRFLKEHGSEGWIVIENYYNLSPLKKLAPEGRQVELLRRNMESISRWFM